MTITPGPWLIPAGITLAAILVPIGSIAKFIYTHPELKDQQLMITIEAAIYCLLFAAVPAWLLWYYL